MGSKVKVEVCYMSFHLILFLYVAYLVDIEFSHQLASKQTKSKILSLPCQNMKGKGATYSSSL